MDLRQLQAVTAVAEHGTFSAAADALGTVQSNVSAHVARLEKELGAVLVDRAGGRLTEEGEALVIRARRIEAELSAIVDDISALRGEVRGTVHLGMIGTTARWLFPRLLAAVHDCHPGVHLVVREGTSTSLEPALSNGDIDLAVVNLPVAGDVVTQVLFEEDLVLVVSVNDPLAAAKHVTLEQLAELELVLPPRGTVFRDELERAVRPRNVTLRAKAEVDGVRTIASITFEGHGPAILPATAIPTWLQPQWALVPVTGLPRRRVGLAQRRRGLLSAPARAVADLVADVVADNSGAKPGLHLITPEAETPTSV